MRIFDHIDLRVADLGAVSPFYRAFLPALGFTVRVDLEGWLQYEAEGSEPSEFFGLIEDKAHTPNSNRIAFWAGSMPAVDQLASLVRAAGAQNIEGPGFESDYYYAVYFDDPGGNHLEICHRLKRFKRA